MRKLLLLLLCVPFIGISQNWDEDYYTNWSVLGWSKDGHVALFEHSVGDMVDGCYYSVVIVNMKTDKVVDELVLQEIGGEGIEFEEYQCDSVYLIRHYDIEIKRLYEKYKIIEYYNNKFHKDSTINNYYEIIFKSKDAPLSQKDIEGDETEGGCELYWCGNRPIDYFLSIKDPKKRSKELTRGTDLCASEIRYVGYFKSPFESRLLMVIYSKESDEGEMYYSTYRFIGCSLNPSTFK